MPHRLYHIEVDGEDLDMGPYDTVPWSEVLQVIGGATHRGAERVVVERKDVREKETTEDD